MKWLYECGHLLEEIPEEEISCSCGLNCEGRPIPKNDREWLQISYWMGWRLEWREIYERGDYPEEGLEDGWWRDEGLGHLCIESSHVWVWRQIMRDYLD